MLCTIFFTAVWWVPVGWGATGQLCFFGLMSSGYWLSFSTFAIPYNALGFELTSEFNERTSVQAYRFFTIQIGGLVLASLYPLCFAKIFAGHAGGRVPPEVTGARWVTLLFGVGVLVGGLAPAIFGREQHVADRQPRVPLMIALRLTFTDKLFLHFMSMIVVSIFGVTTATSIGLYITIYYVFGGDKQAAANMLFFASLFVVGMTLLLTLILPTVSKRVGKKGTILLGQFLLICSGVSAWWLYTPKHHYLLIGSSFLGTAGMACFQILYGSFLGDICDVDELRCGTRREGMYGAAATFLNKLIYASQGMLVGAVLAWAGYSAKQNMQTPDAIWRMRTLYSAAPGVFAAIGLMLTVTFPITARSAAETQQLLAERRVATVAGRVVVGEIV